MNSIVFASAIILVLMVGIVSTTMIESVDAGYSSYFTKKDIEKSKKPITKEISR